VPGDTAGNDLQKLANSYTSHVVTADKNGNSVQIVNSVWAVRSFLNAADFYYVLQEADYRTTADKVKHWKAHADNNLSLTNPGLIQTSPGTTTCAKSTTSSTSWNIGGSFGINQEQGVNAGVSGGVSVSHAVTISCPAVTIDNTSEPQTGRTHWDFFQDNVDGKTLHTFYNQWIWEVPFQAYDQDSVTISSSANELGNATINTNLYSTVPLPFGENFSLQKPTVVSVNPTCVNAGNVFTINGTSLYPSLVTSVLIDGSPLQPTQYTAVSDTLLSVVAPEQSGEVLPVAVQTAEGVSNSNVTIEISVIDLCGAAGVKKK
jgi:hypothetical protein